MSKIPTAEEFVKQFRKTNPIAEAESIEHWMGQHCIEFAKLHVEVAIEAICDNACVTTEGRGFAAIDVVDKSSIQEAYPLTNII